MCSGGGIERLKEINADNGSGKFQRIILETALTWPGGNQGTHP